MSCLAYRRPLYQGAQDGVDRKATLELPNMLSGLTRYRLRCILSGALPTRARLHKLNQEEPKDCPHCLGIPETAEHIFGDCPAYTPIRYTDLGQETWQSLPNCLKHQGIVPLLDEQLPPRFRGDVERKQLGCIMQHNLLDMWEERMNHVDARLPIPRWGT